MCHRWVYEVYNSDIVLIGVLVDLSFSSDNEMLMSSSVDHSVRVWRVSDGKCIRKITDFEEFVSCAFHPFNNNLLFVSYLSFINYFHAIYIEPDWNY